MIPSSLVIILASFLYPLLNFQFFLLASFLAAPYTVFILPDNLFCCFCIFYKQSILLTLVCTSLTVSLVICLLIILLSVFTFQYFRLQFVLFIHAFLSLIFFRFGDFSGSCFAVSVAITDFLRFPCNFAIICFSVPEVLISLFIFAIFLSQTVISVPQFDFKLLHPVVLI